MNHDPSNKLNDLLRQWADNHSASDVQLESLRLQIIARRSREQVSQSSRLMRPPQSMTHWMIGLAISAALLIGVGIGYWMKPPAHDPGVDSSELALQLPHVSKTSRSDSERLCSEMLRLFPRELLWVAETPHGMEMGLSEDDGPSASIGQFVSLEMMVQSRPHQDHRWVTRWNGRLMMQAEAVVKLPTPEVPAGLSSFTFWSLPLSDGTVAVDTLIGSTSPSSKIGNLSLILPAGGWREIAAWTTDAEEIRLLQRVESLRHENKAEETSADTHSPQI